MYYLKFYKSFYFYKFLRVLYVRIMDKMEPKARKSTQDQVDLALPNEQLLDLCKDLDVSDNSLKKVRDVFQRDIVFALAEEQKEKSTMDCTFTFIRDLPTGAETGKFLGLNLTNTYFKIVVVHLTKKEFDVRSKMHTIPETMRSDDAYVLMDHIASHLYAFLNKYRIHDEYLPLVFTFSIPYEQRTLIDGHLMDFNGELTCDGMRTRDVADLLQMAIERIEAHVTIVAIITDVTGMLLSCAWERGNARAAIKMGEAFEFCYVERVDDIPKFKEKRNEEIKLGIEKPYMLMYINGGQFGKIDDRSKIDFIRTSWDKEIDKESDNPCEMAFEKMVCTKYLGEIIRKILLVAIFNGIIFQGESKSVIEERLKTPNSFTFEYLLEVESDPPGKYTLSWQTLTKLGYKAPTRQDSIDLRFVCYSVLQRACRLMAAAAAGVLNHMGFSDVTLAVDGRVYYDIPGFAAHFAKKLRMFTSPFIYCRCFEPMDGVGVGAAMAAAVLHLPKEEKRDDKAPVPEKENKPKVPVCEGIC